MRIVRFNIFAGLFFLLGISACGTTTPYIQATPPDQHHWCGYPTTSFVDAATSPPVIIPDWTHARASLQFSPYLPAAIPSNLCLVSVGTTVHDPSVGDTFSITYAGSNTVVLTIAETSRHPANTVSQCGTSVSNSITIATCQQLIQKTMITITGTYSIQYLHTLLAHLHTNITWLPANPSA